MSEFVIDASAQLIDYFQLIADEMVNAYRVSRAEAVARINCHWRGRRPEDDVVLHGMPEHWAARIYFEDYMDEGQLKKRVKPLPPRDSGCWTVD